MSKKKPEVLFVGVVETACFSCAQRGVGKVYCHPDPKFPDGEKILTSEIVKSGDGWFETLNTVYLMVL